MINRYDDTEYYSQFKKAHHILVEAIDFRQESRQLKFSIIVPYRDNPYQNRKQQLYYFFPYMTALLTKLHPNYEFQIIVVEQTEDGRKFNRGQLLNVGFQIAQAKGCNYHIFHDVDLLPDANLLDYYGFYPYCPLHLAFVWEKYQYVDLYFGGVCSFTTDQFIQLNGYPNDYWGWGGEDEELYHRIVDYDISILRPTKGCYTEMAHVHSKNHPELVNEERFDLIEQRCNGGQDNGLSSLQIKQLYAPEQLNAYTSKYLVDL